MGHFDLVYVDALPLQSILGPFAWDLCFSTARNGGLIVGTLGTAAITSSGFATRAALAATVALGIGAVAVVVYGPSMITIGSLALLLSPVALYVALRWPFEVIFGIYAVLVPFDNLLSTGSFGTLTKLLGILAGGFLLLWVAQRRLISLAATPMRILCVLVVWMLATALWAIDQKLAVQMMQTLAGLMLLYGVLSLFPVNPKQYRLLLLLVVVGGLLAAAYGAHMFYSDPSIAQQTLANRRLVIHIGQYDIDPNHFANALILPAAILAMWALRARRLLGGIASAAGLGLIMLAILLSGSREALMAVLLIAAYYFVRTRYRVRLAVGLGLLAGFAATVQTSIFLRFAQAADTGGAGRTSIWAVALEAVKQHPLQGFGIGNFTQAYNIFYLAAHQPYPYGWDGPAHNLVMHYLVETGIVGLSLIFLFFYAQFRSLRVIDKSSDYYDYRVVFEAALVAIVFVSMFIDLFQYKYPWLIFAMLALTRTVALRYQQSAVTRPTSSDMIADRSGRLLKADLPSSPILRRALLSSSES
jgi:O-antigen ligase